MSACGVDVFDRTLETTHIWLNEICNDLGPDKQAWRVGDRMWMAPPEKFGGIGHADLVTYEPGRALAFATWVVPPRPGERKAAEGSWSFIVEPTPGDPGASRLIVRGRTLVETPWLNRLFQLAVFEPLHFVMERKMLLTIKHLAERAHQQKDEMLLRPFEPDLVSH